jgi:tetratricopeptide (TPR) repeat protein
LAAELPAYPEYRRALARHHHALGVLRTHTERPPEAVQAFQQELAVREKLAADFTEEIDLSLDLAYFLANCPDAKLRQPDRAVLLATKATAAKPKDAWAWTVLGIAQYRAGDYPEAIRVLEKAETLPGKYAGGAFVQALAQWKLGGEKKAEECYRHGSAWIEQHHPVDEELRRLYAEAATMLGMALPKEKR